MSTGGRRILLIPAFNEAAHIARVLEGARAAAADFELVVVDDGSADGTGDRAAAAAARVLRHPANLGYGAALQTGYKYAWRAGAELVVQMDADGQHDPREVSALAGPVERGELDLVIGSRFLVPSGYRMGPLRSAGRRFLRAAARALGLEVTDPTSGFQAMNRRVLALYTRDFFPTDYPDVDVLVAAQRSGLRIGERPVTMGPGLRGSSLHDGLAPLYYGYKMLLSLWAASARAPRLPEREREEGR